MQLRASVSHFDSLCSKSFQMERLSLRESPEETAARECYEETLGIFGDTVKLLHDIRDHKTNNIFKVLCNCFIFLNDAGTCMYILKCLLVHASSYSVCNPQCIAHS